MEMSFVSIVAMENFITVVADKRMIDLETKEVKSESFEKIKRINDFQFVACTGNAGVAEFIFKKFEKGNLYDMQLCAEQLDIEVKYNIDLNVATIQGVIGGRNQQNDFVLYYFSNNPKRKVVEYKPQNQYLAYVLLSSDNLNLNGLSAEQKFEELYSTQNIRSVNEMVKVQEMLNDIVAEKDDSVNKEKMILKLV